MTIQSLVVIGLIVLFSLFAVVLWLAARRRTTQVASARRAQRLQEQLAWDRMVEGEKKKP